MGVKATIVMPRNSPLVKVNATRGYGAEIVFSGNRPEDRERVTEALAQAGGQTFVHPSDDVQVIYGQGTAGLEMHEQHREMQVRSACVWCVFVCVCVPLGVGGGVGTALLWSKIIVNSFCAPSPEPHSKPPNPDSTRVRCAWICF